MTSPINITWSELMEDDEEQSLIQYLTLRRSRLISNSEEPVDVEFSNAQKTTPTKANVMCSDLEERPGYHFLTLDLDMPVELIKSSSGNNHLIVRHGLKFDDMVEILDVLQKHGVVQPKWVESTKKHGYSILRLPGISKNNKKDNLGLDSNGNIETPDQYYDALQEKHQREYKKTTEEELW